MADVVSRLAHIITLCVPCVQGAEKEVIILATTTTNPRSEFCSDGARLNVALTRARRHLVVVGATGVLAQVRAAGLASTLLIMTC
jgi:superfamily I DNA and/or RNA helicase